MSSTEGTQARAPVVQRCPYCHESVSLEADHWVACQQCLARHHEGCWSESSRCASCGSDRALSAAGAGATLVPVAPVRAAAPASPPPVAAVGVAPASTSPVDEDAVRRATLHVLEPPSPLGSVPRTFANAASATLSLGLLPAFTAERAYVQHVRANAASAAPLPPLPADVRSGIEATRARAHTAGPGYAGARLALLALPAAGALALAIGLTAAGYLGLPNLGVRPGLARDLAYLLQLVAWLLGFLVLHLHRELVARHERHQVTAELVANALPPAPSLAFVTSLRASWAKRRLLDLLLMATGLVPVFGLLALPVAALRQRGALGLHEDHEQALANRLKQAALAKGKG